MKNIIKLVAVAAALLPLGQLQAKTFGGFAPKKTFTMKVTTKFVAKTPKSGPVVVVPVPKGMLNLALGQTVTFTIGAKGQLTAKGLEIPFEPKVTLEMANDYDNQPAKPTPQSLSNAAYGQIFKNSKGEPMTGKLKFYKKEGKGLKEASTSVVYELKVK